MNLNTAKEVLGKEFAFTADFVNEIIQNLNLPKNARILDIGTGMGNMAIMLALNGYKVLTGEPETDDSIYAKQDWRKNADKVGVGHLIEFKNFRAENLPFGDGFCDAIFMLGSLHHIDEQHRAQVLQECIRVLKIEGVLCVFEPNQRGVEIIRQKNPSHPDGAEPANYAPALNLKLTKRNGEFFDAFIFQKI